MQPSRIAAVDGLRGLMILSIVLYHAWRIAPVPSLGIAFDGMGFIPVDVFFVLSGFMLMHSFIRNGRRFSGGIAASLYRRISRLMIPYLAGLTLSIAGLALLSPRGLFDVPWEALPVHLVALQNFFPASLMAINGHYWFFAVLVQLSCLFPVIALASNRWGMRSVLFACAVLCLASFGILGPGIYFAKAQYVLIFVMGAAGADWHARARNGMPLTIAAWYAILFASVLSLAGLRVVDALTDAIRIRDVIVLAADVSLGFLGVAAIMLCVSPRPNALRRLCSFAWFVRLGMLSYAVYLIHLPVLRTLQFRFILPTGVAAPWQFGLLVTVGLFAVILLAVPFHRAFVAGTARKSAA